MTDELAEALKLYAEDLRNGKLPDLGRLECETRIVHEELLSEDARRQSTIDEQIAELRAQVARLRTALEMTLPIMDWSTDEDRATYEAAQWAVSVALADTEPAAAWLERQRKLAAAEELERLHGWVRDGREYDRDDARDEIARACWNRAAELRREAGA
jgi:hypothetical protein